MPTADQPPMDDEGTFGRHVSNTAVRLVLEHVARLAGDAAVDEVLRRSGEPRPLPELVDDAGWSSYDAFRSLLEASAETLGGIEALRSMGALADLTGGSMPSANEMLQALGTPGVLFGELPWWKKKLRGHALRGTLAAGFSYVGPRPLPYGARSDTIATLDASATLGWWFVDLSISAQNLLNRQYRLGEYDYVSDFHTTPNPTLVPTRAFAAGAPRQVFFSIAFNYGGRK